MNQVRIFNVSMPDVKLQRLKDILVFYLWDMFHLQSVQLDEATKFVKKTVWNHRNHLFSNSSIFHCVILNIEKYYSDWMTVNDMTRIIPYLRDFFLILMNAHEEVALKKQKIERKRQELQDEKMKLERLQSNVSQGNARLEEMQKEMTALKSELSGP